MVRVARGEIVEKTPTVHGHTTVNGGGKQFDMCPDILNCIAVKITCSFLGLLQWTCSYNTT